MKYGLASWDHKFVDTYLTLHWEKDRLIVERFDIFKDKSGRSNYRKRSEFKKRSNNSRGAGASVPPVAKARYHIRLSQWDKAAAAYAEVDLWARPLRDDVFARACLYLIRGDSEGYDRFCQGMIQRVAQTEDHFEAFVLARSCAMARKSPVDPARAVQWAKQAVAGNHHPWYFHALGLAQYRAGQFDEALQSFTKANVEAGDTGPQLVRAGPGSPPSGPSGRGAAMSGQGHPMAGAKGPPGPEQPANIQPKDWLEAQLLRREAEELLKIKAESVREAGLPNKGAGQGRRSRRSVKTRTTESNATTANKADLAGEDGWLRLHEPPKAAGGVLTVKQAPAGPAPSRRSVCAPERWRFHCIADQPAKGGMPCRS